MMLMLLAGLGFLTAWRIYLLFYVCNLKLTNFFLQCFYFVIQICKAMMISQTPFLGFQGNTFSIMCMSLNFSVAAWLFAPTLSQGNDSKMWTGRQGSVDANQRPSVDFNWTSWGVLSSEMLRKSDFSATMYSRVWGISWALIQAFQTSILNFS